MIDRDSCLNFKIILEECVATQHKLFLLNVCLQVQPKVKKANEENRIKQRRIKEDSVKVFAEKVVEKSE